MINAANNAKTLRNVKKMV